MRTPEEIAEALITYHEDGDDEWRHHVVVGEKATRFNDGLEARHTVKHHRRMIADAIRARDEEWVRLAMVDAPVSAERLAEIAALWNRWDIRMNRREAIKMQQDALALIDHLRAQVALLSRDTGYAEGYAAGRASAAATVTAATAIAPEGH